MTDRRKLQKQILPIAPVTLDLRRGEDLSAVRDMADHILEALSDEAAVAEFEDELIAAKDRFPLSVHLAVKMARSKRLLVSLDTPVHGSVVFAAYKEHNRIQRPEEHEHGEDFLRRKVDQLRWLFDGSHSTWDLTMVDDGCPEGSGRIAERIIETSLADEPVRVLFLENAIQDGHPMAEGLTSTAESNKGGAIEYGMWEAAGRESARPGRHVIAFTDADLSTHLGQLGLLIDGIVTGGADAAIGSRREKASVVIKKGVRNTRGKLFIYLWKRMLPILDRVVDTQCGFKAFRAETIRETLDGMIEKKFAFDIELLLKTELRRSDSITKVPIAWIDSEAGSTTTELSPYLGMLQSVARFYRKYLPADAGAESFAGLLDGLTEEEWNGIVDRIPASIADRDPAEFGRFDQVTADDLASP